ncbi:hypothetical protein [Dactylosporangium cerinum]
MKQALTDLLTSVEGLVLFVCLALGFALGKVKFWKISSVASPAPSSSPSSSACSASPSTARCRTLPSPCSSSPSAT